MCIFKGRLSLIDTDFAQLYGNLFKQMLHYFERDIADNYATALFAQACSTCLQQPLCFALFQAILYVVYKDIAHFEGLLKVT
jgi:hypothetical protein